MRGRNDEEDKALEAELLSDEKELAEHNMLVDLGRNDIGKVSRLGTVKVEKYCTHREIFLRNAHRLHSDRENSSSDKDAVDAVDATTSGRHAFGSAEVQSMPDNTTSWRATSAAYTAAPSDISTLQAIWTHA